MRGLTDITSLKILTITDVTVGAISGLNILGGVFQCCLLVLYMWLVLIQVHNKQTKFGRNKSLD